MSVDRSSQSRRRGSVPLDLVVVIAVTILVNAVVFVPGVRSSPLRVPLGFSFVFFVPGYVLIATLFPESEGSISEADSARPLLTGSRRTIDGLERVVLSFGASVAIVPGLALLLNYTPWGIRPVSVLVTSTVVTLVLTITAIVRRQRLSEAERFRIPVRRWLAAFRNRAFGSNDRAETVLTALLVASVLVAAGSVAYAVATPADGERFSEVYLSSENEDGELSADEYPTEFDAGESRELVVGIENNEHETTEYTVVAVEQTVESDGGEFAVTDQRELTRFETRLEHGETWEREHDIEPTLAGENVRIVWLVYLGGDVPDEPSTENAAYHVHLWVDTDVPDGET